MFVFWYFGVFSIALNPSDSGVSLSLFIKNIPIKTHIKPMMYMLFFQPKFIDRHPIKIGIIAPPML